MSLLFNLTFILRSLTADQSVAVSTGVNQSEASNLSLGQSEDSFRGWPMGGRAADQ